MKIDLSTIDQGSFMVHESTAYGEPLYLVQPQHIGCKWTQENKIFRSSIWNKEGELVSAGFPKFPNWGEQPDVFPLPTSLKGCNCIEKLDGSSLIVSKYRGRIILRTRGTFDASVHENGAELEEFLKRYPTLSHNIDTGVKSLIFEWTSPNQRIVLNYGDKPTFVLIGGIYHKDYSLFTQAELDTLAEWHDFDRPKVYSFDSIENLSIMVKEWKGKEGVVVYSKDDQVLHKVKSAWYLALHKMKSEIANIENLVDVYLTWEMPEYEAFEARLVETFDYELFSQIIGDVSKICEAKKNADRIVAHMKHTVPYFQAKTRKEAALEIIDAYGATAKKGIMFNLLDGRELDSKAWKTLIMQGLTRV